MNKRKRSKFDDLSEITWRTVGELARSLGDKPLPVQLDEVASSFGIQYVRFEPLLSTAKLVKIEDGFYILMNTEAPGANQPPGTILDVDKGVWSDLAPPLRFTIAHEIAHAVFSKSGWDSNLDLYSRHDKALESTCSQMARVLLLPPSRLVQEWDGRLFDVGHIQTLLTRFRVSAQAFILRLQLPDLRGVFNGTDGMLAFAREEESRIRIIAYHTWGPLATGRFETVPMSASSQNVQAGSGTAKPRGSHRKGLEGRPIGEIAPDFEIERWLSRGERDIRSVPVVWRPGMTLPCEMSGCLIHSNPPGFLFSIRVEGPPEADPGVKKNAEF
jgi:hypothetical protein